MINALLVVIGAVIGISLQLNMLAARPDESFAASVVIARIAGGAAMGPILIWIVRKVTATVGRALNLSPAALDRMLRWDVLSYVPLLAHALGAFGVRVTALLGIPIAVAFCALKVLAFVMAFEPARRRSFFSSKEWLAALFFLSGFAALIYQIVWQRLLFSIYGVNIESITVVVAIFMLGLGVGALAGGLLSKKYPDRLPSIFLFVEIAIGVFGALSLPLIKSVGALTITSPQPVVTLMIFTLLIVPTMLMGATLPALVAYLYKHYRHVGQSVGTLYFINTLGSATACFVTAHLLFLYGGMQSSVVIAAGFNIATGVLVYRYMQRIKGAAA